MYPFSLSLKYCYTIYRYYIGTPDKDATFPINTWNHFETELTGVFGRTNNAQVCKMYHFNNFNANFRNHIIKILTNNSAGHIHLYRSKYTKFKVSDKFLFRVIKILKNEDNISTQKLRPHLVDPTEPVNIYPRKRGYIHNDEAINMLVNRYHDSDDISDTQVLAHLMAVQQRLSKNDFSTWDDDRFPDPAIANPLTAAAHP